MRIHQASMFCTSAICSLPFHTLIITSCTTSLASSLLPNIRKANRKSLFFEGNTRFSKASRFIVQILDGEVIEMLQYKSNYFLGGRTGCRHSPAFFGPPAEAQRRQGSDKCLHPCRGVVNDSIVVLIDYTQFSTVRLATRLNSLSLLVTSIRFRLFACAAINRSSEPIGRPLFARS